MASEKDNFDQILSARMSKLAEQPLSDSIVDNVSDRLVSQFLGEIELKQSFAREWILLAAAALALLVVALVVPDLSFSLPTEVSYFSEIRATLAGTLQHIGQISAISPYILVLVPAGLVFAFE